MGYEIAHDPDVVLPHLREFSDADIKLILDCLDVYLGEHGDSYRNNADLRLSPGSPNFSLDLIVEDPSGRLRHFRFIVSDAKASYGVLLVRFFEELT